MPSLYLSKDNENAIATVVQPKGNLDGLFLNVDNTIHYGDKTTSVLQINPKKYAPLVKSIPANERPIVFSRLQVLLNNNQSPSPNSPKNILAVWETIQEDVAKNKTKIDLPVGASFKLCSSSDEKKRTVYYCAGSSGSGKSWIAKALAESYHEAFPDRNVYLISQLDEDATLDKLVIKKDAKGNLVAKNGEFIIRLDISKIVDSENSISPADFENSFVIADDYDTLPKKELKAVQNLINQIAIMGRHKCVSMMVISHYITNYSQTRLILNETMTYILYPLSTGAHALSYLLKTQVSMDEKDIKALKKLGRWVAVSKNFPQTVVSEHCAYILNVE